MQTLKNYSDKLVEVQLFKNNHADVFQELENKQAELEELEKELKAEVKETGNDIENDVVKITVSEAFKKYYDFDAFVAFASELEVEALTLAKGIEKTIDKEVFDELVKQNLISGNTKQASFKEEQMTTRIIIKNKLK